MKTTKILSLAAAFGFLAACGEGTGEIEFELAIGNDNIRTINVNVGGETRTATVNEFTVTLDAGFVEEAEDVFAFFETKEVFDFGAEREVEFEQAFEVEPIVFNEIGVKFGNADAAIAGQIGDADFEGNSLRIEGTIDLDPNVAGEETTFIARIPAPLEDEGEVEFAVDVPVEEGKEIKAEVVFELEALFAGIDFIDLVIINNELIIDEGDANNAAAVALIQATLVEDGGALSALSE